MANLGALVGHPAPPDEIPSDNWVLAKCRVGLEYEFENPGGNRIPRVFEEDNIYRHFQRKGDGSLRDNGVEFILINPLLGADLELAIMEMERFQTRTKLVGTYRTSLHVHLDVRDLEVGQLKTLAFLYALTEKHFYNFANNFAAPGPHGNMMNKENSNYCIPWYSSDGYAARVGEGLFSPDADVLIGKRMSNLERYAGLNLQAVARFGSVEFRHMSTVTVPAVLTSWINMCMSLKKAAIDQPLDYWETLAWEGAGPVQRQVFPRILGLTTLDEDSHELCHTTACLIKSVVDVGRVKIGLHPDFKGVNPHFPKNLVKEAK